MDSNIATHPLGEQLAQYGRGAQALAAQILGNRDEAADAVQDALIRALQQAEAFDERRGALRAWFFGIGRHRCLDLGRRRRDAAGDVEALPGVGPTPEENAVADEGAARVRAALARLRTAQREVLILRDFNDLDYAEIAIVLGVPKGTVMSRLHRARMALRQEMIQSEPN